MSLPMSLVDNSCEAVAFEGIRFVKDVDKMGHYGITEALEGLIPTCC